MADQLIDTQHHYLPPGYHAALAAQAARSPAFAQANGLLLATPAEHPARQLDGRLAEMDAAGIDVVVLSSPGAVHSIDDVAAMREPVAAANDELAAVCEINPDRFVMLALLPLPDLDGALAELDRLAAQACVRGLCVGVDSVGYRPDEDGVEVVLARAAQLAYPVVVHPAGSVAGPNGALEDYGLGHALSPMVWTSVVALRAILSGLLDRVPDLELVVPHLGGLIPYLAQRLDDQSLSRADHDLEHYLRSRLYYDNCSFHPPALRCAIDTVGAERLMLGSDYPFRGPLSRCIEDIRNAELDEEDTRRILRGTAARWFAPAQAPARH